MKKAIAKLFFQTLWGWSINGEFPKDLRKAIIVAGPHTSNLDFFIGISTRTIQEFPANFLIKSEWTKKPILGWIIKKMGGVGVDRSKSTNLTTQLAEIIRERDEFVLAISPEGTRKYQPKWKSGFWYIAKEANVPIVAIGFDYPTKHLVIKEPFYVSDKDADFAELFEFFKQFKGKHPENGIY